MVDQIKKRRYCPKGVPGDLIDNQFQEKEVGDVDMLESRNQENERFQIFFMKETDYVMKIMENWMAPYELEG